MTKHSKPRLTKPLITWAKERSAKLGYTRFAQYIAFLIIADQQRCEPISRDATTRRGVSYREDAHGTHR